MQATSCSSWSVLKTVNPLLSRSPWFWKSTLDGDDLAFVEKDDGFASLLPTVPRTGNTLRPPDESLWPIDLRDAFRLIFLVEFLFTRVVELWELVSAKEHSCNFHEINITKAPQIVMSTRASISILTRRPPKQHN